MITAKKRSWIIIVGVIFIIAIAYPLFGLTVDTGPGTVPHPFIDPGKEGTDVNHPGYKAAFLKGAVSDGKSQVKPLDPDILSVASNTITIASTFVTYSGVILAVLALILTIVSVCFQYQGKKERSYYLNDIKNTFFQDRDIQQHISQQIIRSKIIKDYIKENIENCLSDIDENLIVEKVDKWMKRKISEPTEQPSKQDD